MENRFRFIAPTLQELALCKWGKIFMALVLAICVVLNPFGVMQLTAKMIVAVVTIAVVLGLSWFTGDIQRRDEQAKYGSVELTDREIRISLSLSSLLQIHWPDFTGIEPKQGWLYFRFDDATITQGNSTQRLDRVRLSELENPDALINALRAQTPHLKTFGASVPN